MPVATKIDPPSDLKQFLALVLPVLRGTNIDTIVDLFLYGIHTALFIICVFILLKHSKSSQHVNLVAVTIMFCLSTAITFLSIRTDVSDLPALFAWDLETLSSHAIPRGAIYVTNNLVADVLLVYRCYLVWGKNRYVLLISNFFLLVDTVWGYLTQGNAVGSLFRFTLSYLGSVFAVNIVITAMTVSRIIWISRKSHTLEKKDIRRYNIIIAVLVESGAIYSLCIFLHLVTPEGTLTGIFFFIVIRMVAIMPTLMIVQVGLGRITEVPDSNNESNIIIRRGSTVLDTVRSLDMRQESGQRYPTILRSTQEPALESKTV